MLWPYDEGYQGVNIRQDKLNVYKARQTQSVLNEMPFQKRQNCALPSKSVDGKQDY